jgi:TetR/AcrR family transcriptional regulator, tetracycline repressor protein
MALSRTEVLDGAMRVLDEVGLEGLTMRRLADALGVQAGAIYWHFANKQDLYDAMNDAMMVGLDEPPLKGPWDVQLAELARRLAGAWARRRDGARLATLGLRPGPNALAVSEKMLRIVRDAGFPKDVTIWATSVLGYYLLGYVTDVQALQAAKARGLESVLRAFEKGIDREQYPFLFELTSAGIMQMMSKRAFETRFEFGLKVILDGLKATRRRSPKRRSTRKRVLPSRS